MTCSPARTASRLPIWVRVRFAPFSGDLLADYDPALVFTDGSIALYSEQFDAFPLRSAVRAERLPLDLSGTRAPASPTRVTFTDYSGAVLNAGQRIASVTLDDDDGTYVLFGPAEPVVTEVMATIIDPELPDWIRESLLRDTPAILAGYSEALGPAPGARPTPDGELDRPDAAPDQHGRQRPARADHDDLRRNRSPQRERPAASPGASGSSPMKARISGSAGGRLSIFARRLDHRRRRRPARHPHRRGGRFQL